MCDDRFYCGRCSYSHYEDYGPFNECSLCTTSVCSSCYEKYNGKILCRQKCYRKIKYQDQQDKILMSLFDEVDYIISQYNNQELIYLIEDIKEKALTHYIKPERLEDSYDFNNPDCKVQ